MIYKKLLTFSFDDGVTQDERFIEILNKYSLKCTFNLNYELLGKEGSLLIEGKTINHTKIEPERVKALYSGHEVASHTLTHPFLPEQPAEEIIRQVEMDREKLSELVDYRVRGFAYPGGGVNYNGFVADVIRNNTKVEYARNTIPTYSFKPQTDLYRFMPTCALLKDKGRLYELWDEFVNSPDDEFKLFYIWGHTYELDVKDDWAFFEDFCKNISGKEDVLYCTNIEAFDYLKNHTKNN